jgi:alkylation response protein AidB-like acyl-CoA dehydrogenase
VHLTQEHREFQTTARELAQSVYRPQAARWDEEGIPVPLSERKRLAELGFLGICLPEAYGGGGAPLTFGLLAIEELAKESQTAAFPVFEANVGSIRVIDLFGTEEQRERWLPPIVDGSSTMAVAISEAEAGSAATDLRTTGEISGDKVVLNGTKMWCSNAGHAELYLVYARMSDAPGARGIGAVVVEANADGLSFGPRRHHMGFRGIPHADMFFTDCQVPVENVIVEPGGFSKLWKAFAIERLGNATMSLAIAAACIDRAVDHALEREQFGRPIVEFQAVQLMLADMVMRTEAARLLIWKAATDAGTGWPTPLDSSMAKCFANENATWVADSAMRILGAAGYSTEHPIERYVRDSRGWEIAGGTPTMQRIQIASRYLGRRFDQRSSQNGTGSEARSEVATDAKSVS